MMQMALLMVFHVFKSKHFRKCFFQTDAVSNLIWSQNYCKIKGTLFLNNKQGQYTPTGRGQGLLNGIVHICIFES